MKQIRILISIILLLLCVVPNVLAQQDNTITVSGTVTDENKEPMIGVNIYVKNEPGFGVNTNLDGKYTIKVKRNATLIFSFVGYDKKEIEVDGRTVINV
ncbi:MAG: carboxypeptidase-like regulatory domain-containing protein, partial [Paludibacter sp.]|nr:carboxypeptidase-like regulatory domain-containing protein [Paludibacter sp.]